MGISFSARQPFAVIVFLWVMLSCFWTFNASPAQLIDDRKIDLRTHKDVVQKRRALIQ